MIIAVDFDGTIVEHKYPEIGRELPFAIETLKKLQQERHRLILWSVREGKLLQEAVDFCRERGLEFYGLSGNFWLLSFKISYLCLPLFYEPRTTPSCHPSGCAYRQL